MAVLSDKKTFPILARLLGARTSSWEDFLRRQHGNLLPLLQDYRDAPLLTPQASLRKDLDRAVDLSDANLRSAVGATLSWQPWAERELRLHAGGGYLGYTDRSALYYDPDWDGSASSASPTASSSRSA